MQMQILGEQATELGEAATVSVMEGVKGLDESATKAAVKNVKDLGEAAAKAEAALENVEDLGEVAEASQRLTLDLAAIRWPAAIDGGRPSTGQIEHHFSDPSRPRTSKLPRRRRG